MGGFGVAQIVIFIGFLELFVMKQKEGSFPGDMSLVNPFEKQWESFSEETKLRKRAIELNNGRAAQMGIFAMVIHEVLNNQPYIINDILGERLCRHACLPSLHCAAGDEPRAASSGRDRDGLTFMRPAACLFGLHHGDLLLPSMRVLLQ